MTDAEIDAKDRAQFAETLQGVKNRYAGRTIWFGKHVIVLWACTAPWGPLPSGIGKTCDSMPSVADELSGAFRVLDVVAAPDCAKASFTCYIWFKTDRPGKLAYLAFTHSSLETDLKYGSPKGYEDILFEDPAVTAQKAKQHAAKAKTECERRGGVTIGMTKEQVYASCWGKPYKVNTTVVANGRHEQWIYDGGYLYFLDGVLTGIQTSHGQ
jgi:hypothetical protein